MMFKGEEDTTQTLGVGGEFAYDDELLFEIDTGHCVWVPRSEVERLRNHLTKLLESA